MTVVEQRCQAVLAVPGAAGWPFFRQLIAHDITADRSPVGPHADLAALRNARSPKLNLEMVYGDGPAGAPYWLRRCIQHPGSA